MKKAACIVLLLWLGVLSINIARRVAPAREPVYDGKRLRAWLEDLNSTSLYTQETAQVAIREIGTNAVPALVQMLQSSNSLFKLRLMELVGKQSLVRYRFRVAQEDHLLAIKGCRALGPLARPAIPALLGLLNYCASANEAACSLFVIDQGIFPLGKR